MIRDICVIVPAFNEASVIATTVADLLTEFTEVVVIDDGSTDDTAAIARDSGATVLRHVINRGQGAALQTGLTYFASRSTATHCVSFDADGQHRVADAVRMVQRAREDRLDVVLASRFLGHSEDMPRSRRLLLRWAIRFSRLTSDLPLTDTHNGLRVLSRNAADRITLRHDRMAYATELESAIATQRLAWAEEPTTVVYTEYSRAKGQRNSNAINIVFDLAIQRIRHAR